MSPPDGLLTTEANKHDVDLEPHIIAQNPINSDDSIDDFDPVDLCLLTTTEGLNMNTSEDEPSSGLNGRLRPRKSHVPSPQGKGKIKSGSKASLEKPKRTSTPSKVSLIKQDDLANKSDTPSTPNFFCTFCDRKFASRQTVSKHIRRIHYSTSKQDVFLSCLFCNHTEADTDIIRHMVNSHPNQYFACLDCHTRFSSTSELAEHKLNVCEKQKVTFRTRVSQKISRGSKKTKKTLDIARKSTFSKNDTEFQDGHGFNGIVISCELKPPQDHDGADIEDNITTNLILPPSKNLGGNAVLEKNAVIVLDDIQWNKRIPPNFAFHNSDPDQILSRLGVVHRSPRTGESTRKDWFKTLDDSTQKFERCFDTKFYSKVASNVQENLAKYLDGSFSKPDRDSTIKTRKAKNNVVINTAEGFPILLASEQYSRSVFDSYMPRAIAPKHKWKWDSVENDRTLMTAAEILKRDSHTNNCIITLVSSLDIWTQLSMRRKFEDKFNIQPIEKKTEKQNIISKELKQILESREIPTSSQIVKRFASKPAPRNCDLQFPASLGLVPATPTYELQPAVLSGEWVRPRCYVCCACGHQTTDSKGLSLHLSTRHPNAHVQYYEIVGDQLLNADILKHLYVSPSQVSNRTRPPRGFRECTKCNKSVTLDDLHQHMLDCAGDTPAVRRRQPRQRPFGVRRRRSRIPDTSVRKKIRKDIRSRQRRQKIGPRPRIRTEVGDAETIRKMLADLPAKRHRVLVNPMVQRPRRKLELQRNKLIMRKRSTEQLKNRKQSFRKETSDEKQRAALDEENRKTPSLDDDEDNKPLKPKLKLISNAAVSRRETLKRQVIMRSVKRKAIENKIIVETAEKNEDAANSTDIQEASFEKPPERLDIKNAPYNTREHANRGSSHSRDDQRPGCSGTNRPANNPCAPPQNAPLKHSIARLTANSETHDKSVQFHHSFLVQQECNNTNQHVPTGQRILFENEAIVSKLDKPPLNFCQKSFYDKNKTNKPRKGLNDCIAMLKNKLSDPVPNQGTGHVSVQCGSDEPIDDEPRIAHKDVIDKDPNVDLHPDNRQPEDKFPYRHETIQKSRSISESSQPQESFLGQYSHEIPQTPEIVQIQEKTSQNCRQDTVLQPKHTSLKCQDKFDVLSHIEENNHKEHNSSECVQTPDNYSLVPQYRHEAIKHFNCPSEGVQVQGSYSFMPQYQQEITQKYNQNLDISQHATLANISMLPLYPQETTNSLKQTEENIKIVPTLEKTGFNDDMVKNFSSDISTKTRSRRDSSRSQTADTIREHSKRRSIDVCCESDVTNKGKSETWQKSLDTLPGKSTVHEVLPPQGGLLSKALDVVPSKVSALSRSLEIITATALVPSQPSEVLSVRGALPKPHEVIPAKIDAFSKAFEVMPTECGALSKSLGTFVTTKSNVAHTPLDVLPAITSVIPKSHEVLPGKSSASASNTKQSHSYTDNVILLNKPETRPESEIPTQKSVNVFTNSRIADIPINIPPAHASTKVESIISAPLDLSSKMIYASHLPSAENYETLDLSNKRIDETMEIMSSEEDMIVDLRVKPSEQRDSPITLDLCIKSANNNTVTTPTDDIHYTYPTDLSVRGKDSRFSEKACKRSVDVDLIQDIDTSKNISLSDIDCLVVSSNNNNHSNDLSNKMTKIRKCELIQDIKEAKIVSEDSFKPITTALNELTHNAYPEKQKTVKYTQDVGHTSVHDQNIVQSKNSSPASQSRATDLSTIQMHKHIYDPNLKVPQFKMKPNTPVTEIAISGVQGNAAHELTTPSKSQGVMYSKSFTESSQVLKITTITSLAAEVNRIESAIPMKASITVTKTDSPQKPILTDTLLSTTGSTKTNVSPVNTLTDTVITTPKHSHDFVTESSKNLNAHPTLSNDASTKTSTNQLTTDQDADTAKKIAMLPKELVEILGNMPIDHRNQLLNILPQYVSTTVPSSPSTNQPIMHTTATTVSNKLEPVGGNRNTNNNMTTDNQISPVYSSVPKQVLNVTATVTAHNLLTENCQTLNELIHPLPVRSTQYTYEEQVKVETGTYLLDAKKINISSSNDKEFVNTHDKIIDLTEDDHLSPVPEMVDLVRSITIPAQHSISGGIQSKKNSNSDKTASLRAVRIKAPSERQKSNEMLNRVSVEQLPAQKVNDVANDLNKSSEFTKSLAIQQAEISSTQHNNKTSAILSKTPAQLAPEEASKDSNKTTRYSTLTADIVNEPELTKPPNTVPVSAAFKSSIVTSSIPVISVGDLSVKEINEVNLSQSTNTSVAFSASNTDLYPKYLDSDIHNEKDLDKDNLNKLPTQDTKCNLIPEEEDSEDDMILAAIVKLKQNHRVPIISKGKRKLKQKKRIKKSKKTILTQSSLKNEDYINAVSVNADCTNLGNNNTKRRSTKINEETNVENSTKNQTDLKIRNVPIELNAYREESKFQSLDKHKPLNYHVSVEYTTEICETTDKSKDALRNTEIQAATINQKRKTTKHKQCAEAVDHYIVKSKIVQDDTRNVVSHLKSCTVDLSNLPAKPQILKIDDSFKDDLQQHSKPLENSKNQNITLPSEDKNIIKIDCSKRSSSDDAFQDKAYICTDSPSNLDLDNNVTLRRSRRGKSFLTESANIAQETVADTTVDQKAPLTKKQLIFSKLLLDEENNTKSLILSPEKDAAFTNRTDAAYTNSTEVLSLLNNTDKVDKITHGEKMATVEKNTEAEKNIEEEKIAEVEKISEAEKSYEVEKITEAEKISQSGKIDETEKIAESENMVESDEIAKVEINAEIKTALDDIIHKTSINEVTSGKSKPVKRKKSPQLKRKTKKKKSVDSVHESKNPDRDKLRSHDKTNLETLFSAIAEVEPGLETIGYNKSTEELCEQNSNSSSAESHNTDKGHSKIETLFKSDDTNQTKTSNTSEKRKTTTTVEFDLSSKPKKTKFNNNKETEDSQKETNKSNVLSSELVEFKASSKPESLITCYDVPIAARRTRSRSVGVKSSSAESYDPYNIDLDEMIQKPEPLRKNLGKSKQEKRKRKGSCKTNDLKNFQNKETVPVSSLTVQDEVGVPGNVPSCFKKKIIPEEHIIEKAIIEHEINAKKFVSHDYTGKKPGIINNSETQDTANFRVKDTVSDSDESSKSDVPLKKYVEDKVRKISEIDKPSTSHTDFVGNKNKSRRHSGHKKGPRTSAANKSSGTTELSNEIEEQIRSEQFMESFGFFSERKPRKSNLLATKKISETFHIIANDSDDLYYGSKEKVPKRSLQTHLKKSSDSNSTDQSTSKKSAKRGRKKKEAKIVSCYCDVCKKEFRRPDNFVRHNMTLLHIARMAEVELKIKVVAVPEEPNYLIAYKQHMDRLKILTDKAAKQKKNCKNKIVLPTIDEVLADVFKTIRDQQLARRGLSRDEALFLDCCELLKESHRPDAHAQATSTLNTHEQAAQSSTSNIDFVNKNIDRSDSKSDGDVDSITAKTILESEEVRNLENDLISGLKEAANAKHASKKMEYHATPCTMTIDTHEISAELFLRPGCDLHCEQIKMQKQDFVASVDLDTTKTKKIPEYKEKMYPDIIEDIDMYEDKFDKIKRKCRSQAAAAKQVKSVAELTTGQKGPKKTDKRKGKNVSKKNYQNTVLTKGALKGFDGIKVSIPTSDINISAIVQPPHETSSKKKKKTSSKKKREKRDSETSSKYDSDNRFKESSSSQKKVDVYEFMDNEDAELFEFRPSTLMERFKSFNKETQSTSKRDVLPDEPDNSSESASDGDDFVYMSDDYVCSDDETENSLISEIGTGKNDPKKTSPLKRKDVVEKNAVMGKIFKLAVRSEKKHTKSKETVKPKANLDQLFDSLLEEQPNSSKLNNDSNSPKHEEKDSVKPTSEPTPKYEQSSLDQNESRAQNKISSPDIINSNKSVDSECDLPIRKHDFCKRFKYGPSTSKQQNFDIYGPSTSGNYSALTKEEINGSTTKTRDISPKKYDKSPKHRISPLLIPEKSEFKQKKQRDRSPLENLRKSEHSAFELDEDTGVARHRARRKCTVGKQNVLAETWSSESEPDGQPPRPTSAESVVAGGGRKKKNRKKDGQPPFGRRGKTGFLKKQDIGSRVISIGSTSSSDAASHSGTAGARFTSEDVEDERNIVDSMAGSSRHELCPPPAPRGPSTSGASKSNACKSSASTSGASTSGASTSGGSASDSGAMASKVRSRPTTYFWKSEGDEEQEQQQQQHGWIVGNSHKRLVTMLANAKGRKRNNDDKRLAE